MAQLNPTNLGQLKGKLGEVVYYVTPDGISIAVRTSFQRTRTRRRRRTGAAV